MLSNYYSDFFFLRTPQFPISRILNFYENISFGQNGIRDFLIREIKDPIFSEALYIASPDLYYQTEKYIENNFKDSRKCREIEISLIEYFTRMSTRCTPFGLFSVVSYGTFGQKTQICVNEVGTERKITFDSEFLSQIVSDLEKNVHFRMQLKYFVNNSLSKRKNRLSVIKYTDKDSVRRFETTYLKTDLLLNKIIKLASSGIRYSQLVDLLTNLGYTEMQSIEYIDDIIDSQILISELEPSLLKGEYFNHMLETLKNFENPQIYLPVFKFATNKLANINSSSDKVDIYKKIYASFRDVNSSIRESKIFQVDSINSESNNLLDDDILKSLMSGVEIVKLLNPTNNLESRLEEFKTEFYKRYEDHTVRLVDVFDSKPGANYNNISSSKKKITNDDKAEKFKFELFKEFIETKNRNIEISEEKLRALKMHVTETKELPDSFSILASIFKREFEIEILFKSATGPSAINSMSRFANYDTKISSKLKFVCEMEEALDPDFIFAEVIHFSHPRLGNLVSRPKFRRFEIPFLAKSNVDENKRVLIGDMYLKMEAGELILLSKKLNKRIIPRLSTAHNYALNTLSIYNFLCDLQRQNIQSDVYWRWNYLEDERILPRVIYRNLILTPAIWNINISDFKNIVLHGENDKLFDEFQLLRAHLLLPDQVLLCQNGDLELFLNLKHEICIFYLIEKLKKYKKLKLKEVIWHSSLPITNDGNGDLLANEFVIPFSKLRENNNKKNIRPVADSYLVAKSTKSKNNWIYFKIYLDENQADDFLLNKLYSQLIKLKRGRTINKWFFIRYEDPEYHIRLRLKCKISDYEQITGQIVTILLKAMTNYIVKDFLFDEYIQELNRYKNIDLAERLFYINSCTVCEVLKYSKKQNNDYDLRFYVGNCIVEHYSKQFILNLDSLSLFYEEKYNNFKNIFAIQKNKNINRELSEQYKQHENLFNSLKKQTRFKKITQILNRHNRAVSTELASDKIGIESNDYQFLSSLIHMSINRLYDYDPRFQEMKHYHYLNKRYKEMKFNKLKRVHL